MACESGIGPRFFFRGNFWGDPEGRRAYSRTRPRQSDGNRDMGHSTGEYRASLAYGRCLLSRICPIDPWPFRCVGRRCDAGGHRARARPYASYPQRTGLCPFLDRRFQPIQEYFCVVYRGSLDHHHFLYAVRRCEQSFDKKDDYYDSFSWLQDR